MITTTSDRGPSPDALASAADSLSIDLQDAVAALSIELTPEEVATLEAPYIPHAVAGFA